MIGVTANVAMQIVILATGANSYQDAYQRADEEGKPLLVLVGADWCPGCRTMKLENIPELKRLGGLKRVVYAVVNTDEKPTLSRRLLRGNSIPQLVLFTRSRKGWRRAQLTGVHDPAAMQAFLDREMSAADTESTPPDVTTAAAGTHGSSDSGTRP